MNGIIGDLVILFLANAGGLYSLATLRGDLNDEFTRGKSYGLITGAIIINIAYLIKLIRYLFW